MFAPKVTKPPMRAAASSTSKLAPRHSLLAGHRLGHDNLLSPRGFDATWNGAGDHEQEAEPASLTTAHAAKSGPSWDFSKIPLFPPDRTIISTPRIANRRRHTGKAYCWTGQ
jgi:hypothetical protein